MGSRITRILYNPAQMTLLLFSSHLILLIEIGVGLTFRESRMFFNGLKSDLHETVPKNHSINESEWNEDYSRLLLLIGEDLLVILDPVNLGLSQLYLKPFEQSAKRTNFNFLSNGEDLVKFKSSGFITKDMVACLSYTRAQKNLTFLECFQECETMLNLMDFIVTPFNLTSVFTSEDSVICKLVTLNDSFSEEKRYRELVELAGTSPRELIDNLKRMSQENKEPNRSVPISSLIEKNDLWLTENIKSLIVVIDINGVLWVTAFDPILYILMSLSKYFHSEYSASSPL